VEAIIGAGLAKSMSVGVGDGLTLLSVTSDGALNGVDVQIAGIVTTGVAAMDARYLRITLNSRSGCCRAIASPISCRLDSTANTDAVYNTLIPRLNGNRSR